MSAFNLLFLFFLTLACRTLAGEARTGMKWVNSGGSVTIHCTAPVSSPGSWNLKSGLLRNEDVVYSAEDGTLTVQDRFKHRLREQHKDLTKWSVTIKNLTVEDTGVYWCVYEQFDSRNGVKKLDGSGSVLLVVNGRQCNGENNSILMNLVLVSALTVGSVLLLTLIIVFLWIIPKIKARRATMKPNPPKTSDVYEEMRATLRH